MNSEGCSDVLYSQIVVTSQREHQPLAPIERRGSGSECAFYSLAVFITEQRSVKACGVRARCAVERVERRRVGRLDLASDLTAVDCKTFDDAGEPGAQRAFAVI